jgi:transcriptional regulator with XRE-family HTH domain
MEVLFVRKVFMQTPISEYIRQLRRQRGMTQTELGGEHFSKSYVSAVEREKIVPSYEALRFFAEQLDQSVDDLQQIAEQTVYIPQSTTQLVSSLPHENDSEPDESTELLDIVLEGIELPHASFSQEISALPLETLLHLPPQKQARYCLMKGLILQEQGKLEEANLLLERALVLSPVQHQPAILDALGTNCALAFTYQTALGYHQRALHLLELDERDKRTSALFLKVQLHCGDDYRALSIHTQALEQYEHARQSLRSSSNMEIAGQIYIGLGYCTYASIYQEPGSTTFSYEEKERLLQRATSFLLQGRTLYQVSSNQTGESKARLLHAIILLGICSLRRQSALQQTQDIGLIKSLQCATLLDEAEEQCNQVLLNWKEPMHISDQIPPELEIVLYTALSSLTRVYTQRAAVARLEKYSDTALRDRARATHLCQRILDTLTAPELLHSLLRDALVPEDGNMYRIQALPRLPDTNKNWPTHNPISVAAIFAAAGEVAEELGRSATTPAYTSDCYVHASKCFKASLHIERQSTFSKEYDRGFLIRNYQRYITLIEERLQIAPALTEETGGIVIDLFKDMLYQTL